MSDENLRIWNITAERYPMSARFGGDSLLPKFKPRTLEKEEESSDSGLIQVPFFYRMMCRLRYYLARFSNLVSS
jgi:hypothetical protein